MSRDRFYSMKTLTVALCLLFIASLGLNVYYFSAAKSEERNDIQMYKYYMEMHAVSFSNALSITGGQEITDYIKNPDHLSQLIEGIELAEFQYLVAAKYVPSGELKKRSLSILQSRTLINGYLSELRAYRTYLSLSNNQKEYGKINRIHTVIEDLITISKWINKNTDFLVYSDQEFAEEVIPLLQSDLKSR